MRRVLRRAVWLALLLAGCASGAHALGDACSSDADCGTDLACAGAPFPGGYCTVACSGMSCPDGETCASVANNTLCLKPCTTAGDCRDGYQCYQGSCQIGCKVDADCGSRGFQCTGGQCTPFSGSPVGASCGGDMDCSSRICVAGKCQLDCNRDAVCAMGQTCFLDPTGDGVATPTTHLQPICVQRRGSGAPAAACTSDGDCDRGTCQLGVCVELCTLNADCHGPGLICADLVTLLDNDTTPAFKGCLPQTGTLSFPGDKGVVPLPSNAQAFAVYSRAVPFSFSTFVGVSQVTNPAGTVIYTPAQTTAAFYALDLRYAPAESSSTMLVPNSPKVMMMPGAWRVDTGVQPVLATMETTYYVKLGASPIASGKIDLNFYVTDLSGACLVVNAASAPSALAADIGTLKNVFAQVGITVENVTFKDVTAMNTVRVDMTTTLPDLDNTLQAATAGTANRPGLDVVLVRSITDGNGMNVGILGVAGGVPGSPVLGSPHSGSVVAISNACSSPSLLGTTAAHEVAHTLGLFHSVEQDNHHDPLTDTAGDGTQNLMYWSENSGMHLTLQQGQVLRNDPKVRP